MLAFSAFGSTKISAPNAVLALRHALWRPQRAVFMEKYYQQIVSVVPVV